MSEPPRKQNKSFLPYIRQDFPSVENSTDPLKPLKGRTLQDGFLMDQFLHSPDQPYNSMVLFYPSQSYDGIPIDKQLQFSGINNSVDSKQYQRRGDFLPGQSRIGYDQIFPAPIHPFFPYIQQLLVSPHASFMVQPQELQEKKTPPVRQHFKKEEFKLLKEEHSVESEPMQVEEIEEESSWDEKPKRKRRGKRNVQYQGESSESFRICKKKKTHKINDTKNITKNYSKAIISFIINNQEMMLRMMTKQRYDEFVGLLKSKKNAMTNIKQLRDLWVDGGRNQEFNKIFRIISQHFLKKQAIAYVYNSRISNTAWHLKYRQNLLRALHEPENFKFIKDI